jgi:antitoxin component HigA of HigAB toxin-antitoxin module
MLNIIKIASNLHAWERNLFKKKQPTTLQLLGTIMATLQQTQQDLNALVATATALKESNANQAAQIEALTAQLTQANTEAADLQALDDAIVAANTTLAG